MRKILVRTLLTVVGLLLLFLGLVVWSYSGAIFSVDTNDKVVALTYDDGPNPPFTADVLAELRRHDVIATFFLKGRNVEAFPEEARAILAAGHEIGNHSYAHLPMRSLSKAKMLAEITRADRSLQDVLGINTDLFRPPYGLQFVGVQRALADSGHTSIIMNSIGVDWELIDPREIADRVLADVGPGAIILLHDGHGDVDDPHAQDGRAPTVAATRIIIETLRGQGYEFVTISDLLARRG